MSPLRPELTNVGDVFEDDVGSKVDCTSASADSVAVSEHNVVSDDGEISSSKDISFDDRDSENL